jgi:hypothetical protein
MQSIPAIKEGWKPMPVEPTRKMLNAVIDEEKSYEQADIWIGY